MEIPHPTLKPNLRVRKPHVGVGWLGEKRIEGYIYGIWNEEERRASGGKLGSKMSPKWILEHSQQNFEKWRIKFLKNQMRSQIKVSFQPGDFGKLILDFESKAIFIWFKGIFRGQEKFNVYTECLKTFLGSKKLSLGYHKLFYYPLSVTQR